MQYSDHICFWHLYVNVCEVDVEVSYVLACMLTNVRSVYPHSISVMFMCNVVVMFSVICANNNNGHMDDPDNYMWQKYTHAFPIYGNKVYDMHGQCVQFGLYICFWHMYDSNIWRMFYLVVFWHIYVYFVQKEGIVINIMVWYPYLFSDKLITWNVCYIYVRCSWSHGGYWWPHMWHIHAHAIPIYNS